MRVRFVFPAVLFAALAVSGCGNGSRPPATPAASQGPQAPRTEAEKQELSFLIGMVPHHAQAVDMATVCQDRAAHPELRDMCVDIITTQSEEITRMSRWAFDWYGTQLSEVQSALYSAEGASGSQGILTDERLHELAGLSGTAFDLRFVEMMIEHHRGAVASAEGLLRVSPHAETRQLASNIIAAQGEELALLSQWKATWTAS